MTNPVFDRFDRFGGPRGVARLVFRFHDLVLGSDRLRPCFETIDMPRLVEHQAVFVAAVLSGEPRRSETDLESLHPGLGIGPEECDEMIGLLARAVREEGRPPQEAERLLRRFGTLRPRLIGA